MLSKDESSPEDEDTGGHGKNFITKHHLSFSPFHLSLRWNSVWPKINYFCYSFCRHIHISENETVVHSEINITGIGGWIAILVSESLMTAQWRMHDFPDKGAWTPRRWAANHLKKFFTIICMKMNFDQGITSLVFPNPPMLALFMWSSSYVDDCNVWLIILVGLNYPKLMFCTM